MAALPSSLSLSNEFRQQDLDECLAFIKTRFPSAATSITPLEHQGGCSFTVVVVVVVVDEDAAREPQWQGQHQAIVQFRLPKYSLPVQTARDAHALYGAFAPEIFRIDTVALTSGVVLQVCEMERRAGARVNDAAGLLLRRDSAGWVDAYGGFLERFADFHVQMWRSAGALSRRSREEEDAVRRQRRRRLPSPPPLDGKVGSTLSPRLRKLGLQLPSPWLRQTARDCQRALLRGDLDQLPVVLTHGDLIPSNILVRRRTGGGGGEWEITGIVDWAEAEYLPFGMSLYGLEHLLGELERSSTTATTTTTTGKVPRFRYFEKARELRWRFWAHLTRHIPELDTPRVRNAVVLARVIGVLLWHGFAWDDGRIDRIVERARDAEELAYLEAFLESPERHVGCKI